MTTYMVLAQEPTSKAWVELATVDAASDSQAKKKALAKERPEGATVVAIPSRSWKPEDLKPKLSFV
jgi:hypothetical protein